MNFAQVHHRTKQSNRESNTFTTKPQIHVKCVTGTPCVARFDLCMTGGCPAGSLKLQWSSITQMAKYHKYLCTGNCESWLDVFAHTDPHGYVNPEHRRTGQIALIGHLQTCPQQSIVWPCCNAVNLAIASPQLDMTGIYKLGVDKEGSDPWWDIVLTVSNPETPSSTVMPESETATAPPKETSPIPQPLITYLNISSTRLTIATDTGYTQENQWLNWLLYTAKDL